jgi:DNA-binding MarR family transcriptional regulator
MSRDVTELDKTSAPELSEVQLAFIRLRRENDVLVATIARQYGLNSADFRAMVYLRRALDGTPRSLADYLSHSLSATTAMVDRLVAAGYAVRSPNPEDGRSVYLELTADGADVVDRADAIYTAAFEESVPAKLRDQITAAFGHLSDALIKVTRNIEREL